ncbi:SUMO-activating enzyme subunit 1 [Theileria parva strain Muguga]|uniref:SUMO-activating enzyme subunit 1 n=1 Tax=Theileria parva strain Muguga TaxID=333668 RepID=UPI001C616CC3|nr:SUMO-activating enzyme subunit 1 [Theileria parva strain Muguga]EAN30682.2 SUMO-activating enzyme subunit 1 [Theileria parva strain Muguga]
MSSSDDLLEVIDITEPGEIGDLNTQNDTFLTGADEQVYDRQIRLWGIQAQKIIMNSRILFIGKNGILEESMKNLLLSGMNITLVNNHLVTEDDVKLSFFLKSDDVGFPHSERLCERMSRIAFNEKRIEGRNLELLTEVNGQYQFTDPELIKSFHVLVISTSNYPLHQLELIDELCRELGIAFFATLSCGTYGYFFTDLHQHTVLELMNKKSGKLTIQYRNLSSVLSKPQFPKNCEPELRALMALISLVKEGNLDQDEKLEQISTQYNADTQILKEMIKMHGLEFPVTSSILGGYLALEIRKFVTKQHETIPNFCLFDMINSSVSTAML